MHRLSIVLAAGFLSLATSAGASTLVLSGDVNIVNPLNTGSSSASPDAGNATFFRTILRSGSNVGIVNDLENGAPSVTVADNELDQFHSDLGATTSVSAEGTAITSGLLTGLDLFIQVGAIDPFSASQTSPLSAFLAGGGTLVLLGDNDNFPSVNAAINGLLSELGSTMQIVDDLIGAGFIQTTDMEIEPFTSGESTFTYGATSSVTGGTALINSPDGITFVATETISVPPIPLPATAWLLLGGLGGIVVLRKRRS